MKIQIENKTDWKVTWRMPLKMSRKWGQKGCQKSYWYSFLLPLRWTSNILGAKITIFSQTCSFRVKHLKMSVKIGGFEPKNGWKYVEIIFILMAVKKYTSTFWDTLLAPIIAHLQRHPSLRLLISLTCNEFSKYFKLLLIFLSFSNQMYMNRKR